MGNLGVELKGAGLKVGEGVDAKWLFRGLTLSLTPGRCIGIVGPNGIGKTSLLKLCMGEIAPTEGSVRIGQKIVLNYIDQSRLQLSGIGTVLEVIADGDETVRFGDRTINARAYLKRFQFPEHRANEPIDQLSGGERARLLLAKVLKRGGNFLILDEPTNDLDLPSLECWRNHWRYNGSALVVSHDRFFLDRICVVVLNLKAFAVSPGYSTIETVQRKASRNVAVTSDKTEKLSMPETKPKRSRPRKLGYMEERELEGMEANIQQAEEGIQSLEDTLNDPQFYVERAHEAQAMTEALESRRQEVTALYHRWEELLAIKEASEQGKDA